jgi:CDP-glycerol glycerophosphotransferase (TagB/SpsB family)
VRALLVRLGFALGRLTPVRRRVVLATSHADRLSGNLAELRDRLSAGRPAVPVVTLARRVGPGRRARVRAAMDAIVAGWHLATARLFVVDDYYFPMYAIRPRPGTTRVQLWHACGAFKRFGYSVLDRAFGADEADVAAFPIHTNYDVCLVSAARFAPFYGEAFRQPLERITARLGIPRTDLFFDPPRMAAAAEAVRSRYAIPDLRTVILYAPTFRGASGTSATSPNELDLARLGEALAEDHVLLHRRHPYVRSAPPDHAPGGFVIDVADWPELNELMLVSDILVTDYSSAIFEFALLERPIVFFAPDETAYESERGFYWDFRREAPGPIARTTEELIGILRSGAHDLDRVRAFRAASFDVADGRATQRLIDEVVLPALR